MTDLSNVPVDPPPVEEEEAGGLTERIRAFIYRIITPVSALLAFYGIADDQTVALWSALILSVVSGGLAIANTSTKA